MQLFRGWIFSMQIRSTTKMFGNRNEFRKWVCFWTNGKTDTATDFIFQVSNSIEMGIKTKELFKRLHLWVLLKSFFIWYISVPDNGHILWKTKFDYFPSIKIFFELSPHPKKAYLKSHQQKISLNFHRHHRKRKKMRLLLHHPKIIISIKMEVGILFYFSLETRRIKTWSFYKIGNC